MEYITSKRKLLNLNDHNAIAKILKNPEPQKDDERVNEFYNKIGITKEDSDAVNFKSNFSAIQKIFGQNKN